MPQCQAILCTNKSGNCKKSFFQFPDPEKGTEERRLCKKWIENLKNGKLKIETFRAHRGLVVCEDHFSQYSFEGSFSSTVAASLNFAHKKKRLKKGAVPTLVATKQQQSNAVSRKSAESLSSKRRKAQLKEVCKQTVKRNDKSDGYRSSQNSATHTSGTCDGDDTYSNKDQEIPCPKFQPHTMPYIQSDEIVPLSLVKDGIDSVRLELNLDTEIETEWYTAVPLSTTELQVPGEPAAAAESENQKMEKDNRAVFGTDFQQPEDQIKSTCGHPCFYCNSSITSIVTRDHNYAKANTVSIGTQTEEEEEISACLENITHSTPKKNVKALAVPRLLPTGLDDEDDLKDLSFVSHSFRDDSKDLIFTTDINSTDTSMSDSISENEKNNELKNIVSENKYIVFESSLNELFVQLRCPHPECNSPVDPDDLQKGITDDGLYSCKIFCVSGHMIMQWKSQPVLGRMSAGNLLCSAATLFCGQTYTHISEFCQFVNIKFMAESTFHRIQREQVMPVVLDAWEQMQSQILENIRKTGKPLRLAGDGRCDSPGYSAKYCTYTLMELDSNVILTYVVVKVTETGSSARMEAEGFRRCVLFLLDKGFTIEVLATDRHTSIRSIVKKEFSDTNHQFDVWHLGKSIKKKLSAKAKMKGCEDLNPWIKSIINHLWWCASHCNGDKDWLEESWISIVNHSANEHIFEGEKVTECQHGPLDPQIMKRKKWLKRGSRSHNALKEIVMDKRVRKDIRQLSEFCHTGKLEVFHSLMLKYLPKRQEFDDDQMETRTALAVMDHINSLGRQQKTDNSGEKVYRQAFSKITGEWTVKPVYEQKNYMWVINLLEKVMVQKDTQYLPPTELKKKGNIARTPAPPKMELVRSLKSIFTNIS